MWHILDQAAMVLGYSVISGVIGSAIGWFLTDVIKFICWMQHESKENAKCAKLGISRDELEAWRHMPVGSDERKALEELTKQGGN